MKKIVLNSFLLFITLQTFAQLPQIKVSENGRFLITEDGKPFFWTADTAWELFHRLNREEADQYLETRAAQGFNVIQAVALAEIDGLQTPNAYGEKPLLTINPMKTNPEYFKHVDYIIQKAESLGIYIALLPTWGDKVFKDKWGEGPEIFNEETAFKYGNWIGLHYRPNNNIIWVLGGDRNPRERTTDVAVWRSMANGIREGLGIFRKGIFTFHPQPSTGGGSSTWFHNDDWLSFNMHQTGHCPEKPTYKNISYDYNLKPVKPTLDGEPLYEDHPNCFNAKKLGYSVPQDIRKMMYWSVFAGAAGQTYGCHDIWQMYDNSRKPINGPLRPWTEALKLPMANQMKHLKNLMLSRPYLDRIPDQGMIEGNQADDADYVIATRDDAGTYAFVYFPTGKNSIINTSGLKAQQLSITWYDPRTGATFAIGNLQNFGSFNAVPPSAGAGNDWVLVIDDASKKYGRPGNPAY